MEIRGEMSELLSWSKQDGDPFKNTEQADEGCSAIDFSSVYSKGEAGHDSPHEKVLKTSFVLTRGFSLHFRTHICQDCPFP